MGMAYPRGCGGGGGGGILIFSYMRRLGPIFGVPNFEFQYILGVFRKISDQIYWVRGKMHIFWGYEDFVASFFFFFFFFFGGGVITKFDYI